MTLAAIHAAEIRLLRLPQVLDVTGFTHSALYTRMAAGLFVQPIKVGPKRSAWPSHEVQAILQAHVAGASETQINSLVHSLHERRTGMPAPRAAAVA